PLLAGASLRVSAAGLRDRLQRLAQSAGGTLERFPSTTPEALRLAEAAIGFDREALEAAAHAGGADADALATVMQLVVVPLLRACAAQLAQRLPAHWPHGYCPVCGAWAILAELRGMDRSRHLRCGRCGADWEAPWLRCAFCDEQDHSQLGSLVLETGPDVRRVETCDSCGGYLKSIATLQPLPIPELVVRDLETVELDVAAAERGYGRPRPPGCAVAVRIEAGPDA
ncbi:MAG: formate dehydrogenase accessory protein FdhE, partial [Gemmatimonadales bacterium]